MRLFVLFMALLALMAAAGCEPDGGCRATITASDGATVNQACGGSGDGDSPGTVTPAPVIINPPVIITPIAPPAPAPV